MLGMKGMDLSQVERSSQQVVYTLRNASYRVSSENKRRVMEMVFGGTDCKFHAVCETDECIFERQVSRPITALGQMLWDGTDPRLKPVHEDTSISQLTLMAIFLKHRNKYGCSIDDMNELITLTKNIASPGSRIPKDINEMENLTRELLVEHKEHLVCKCEKFMFADEGSCMFCGGRRDMATRYYTIPIGPRLQQLKEISGMARLLQTTKPRPSRFVQDLHESPAWNEFVEDVGRDAIALSYCSDGFNPFHHNITAGNYSIWAQSGLILNLPAPLRSKKTTTMLFGLISGPRAPKKLNIYNKVIIDELLQLDRGIAVFDAHLRSERVLRARVLFTVCDVPGNAKEQNRVQQNAKASCGHCHLNGVHCKILDKTVYPGGRTFLKEDNPMRLDTSFPSGNIEKRIEQKRTRADEIAISVFCDKMEHQTRNTGANNKTCFTAVAQEHGRYGSCEWFRLPYLDMQTKHSPVEPMHALKVVAEHITKLLNGDEDGCKVRAQERSDNRFVSSCPNEAFTIYATQKKTIGQKRKRTNDPPGESGCGETSTECSQLGAERSIPKNRLPPAPFTLCNDEKKTADSRLQALRFPDNFDVPDTLFSNICGGIKTHTWHQLYTTGVLRYCLRGMLGEQQRKSLFDFLRGLEILFSTTDMQHIDRITDSWHITLCCLERDFPKSLQSFVMHLLHHLPAYVKLYGPPSNFWMFPYERFNKTLSQCITNTRNPELNAVKKMEVHWLLTMLECAGYLEPLNSRPEPTLTELKFLHHGSHRPAHRQMSPVEHRALEQLFGRPLDNQDISIYNYARRSIGPTEVRYRGTSLESRKQQQREACSVVSCHLPQGLFVGIIRYFILYSSKDVNHELAFVEWIGNPEQCADSHCYMVQRQEHHASPLMFVSQLSSPLIHAWDRDILWLPSM